MNAHSAPTSASRPRRLDSIERWDMETDVVVAGFGGAGACAAIEAADQGAEVIVLELASDSGGSTRLSSAEIYMGGGTRVQKACGIEDSVEDMFAFLMDSNGPLADEAKIRAYCEGSVAHFDWLTQTLGVPYKDTVYPHRAVMALTDDCLLYTGSEKAWPFVDRAKPAPRGHNLMVEGDNGGALFADILKRNVAQRAAIRVQYEARVLTLVTDDDGAVHGVVVRIDQQERTVRARGGVVLCCGGFAMNEEMLRKHAPNLLNATQPIGNPGDTGGGILMGQGAGGAVANMHDGFVSVPYYPPASLTRGIFVNAQGQRFINEDCYHGRVGYYCLQQPDRRIFLVANAADFEGFETQSYLNAKFAGTSETSVAELEAECGLPEGSLQQTIAFYNRHAVKGEDPLFHKSADWLVPLELPLAAIDCSPDHGVFYPFFTLGGLDTLPTGEVLRPDRSVIPGLYAAGRTAAGVPRTGSGYCSGISVGDASFSGRQAGRSAARRQSS